MRVFRLPQRVELPMLPAYGGCKSWIELEREIATEGSQPVLADAEFARKLARLRGAWAGVDDAGISKEPQLEKVTT